ncbi:two-component system response regulator YesN [Hydrogenispora ethanolica]|uniref:Two-component system response regulator YesN n=1 Tax=Hydrogenispora ethanolica TaxID=1082276 RepID=A0A4R1R8K3_HYDET|nr:response regulator [Hydrogenispora ethanolica]TCL61995.1 two-component system response regulator YesN [Hydrogenispora ethanolica]
MWSYIVVDDEPLIRRGIIQKIKATPLALQLAGEAADGEEALQLLQKADPEIILLDMKLPVLDGKRLLKIIHDSHPGKKVIIISGFSDFEYTQCAIENNVVGYLLKPFNRDEIKQLLEKAIRLIEQEQAKQAKLHSMIQEKEEYQKNLDIQQLVQAITNPFSAIMAAPGGNRLLGRLRKNGRFLMVAIVSESPMLKTELAAFLQQQDHEQRCLHIPVLIYPHEHLLLVFWDNTPETALHAPNGIIARLFQTLCAQAAPETQLYFCLSGVKERLDQLHEAYLECRQILDSRKLQAQKELLIFCRDSSPLTPFHWDDEDYLLFFIESGNPRQVIKYITDLFGMLAKDPDLTYQNVKEICNSLLSHILSLIKNQAIPMDAEIFFDIHQASSGLIELGQLRDLFLGNCLRITAGFQQKNYYASHSLVDNIQKYVQGNYAKALSLQKIATLFFVNPSYCSYIFKEKTGENLSDYINQVRIENAKIILKTTLFNITKVSKAVGYNNASYFFRIFKNYTGLTPWEYKRSVQQADPSSKQRI